jgi:hypothetical protein
MESSLALSEPPRALVKSLTVSLSSAVAVAVPVGAEMALAGSAVAVAVVPSIRYRMVRRTLVAGVPVVGVGLVLVTAVQGLSFSPCRKPAVFQLGPDWYTPMLKKMTATFTYSNLVLERLRWHNGTLRIFG